MRLNPGKKSAEVQGGMAGVGTCEAFLEGFEGKATFLVFRINFLSSAYVDHCHATRLQ